jgi:alpha-glucosidase
MIKRLLLLPLLFFVITNTVAQANTASKQVSTFIITSPQLQTTKKIWVYLPKLYKFNRDIPFYICTTLRIYLIQNVLCRREWNIDEKLDSINAELIVIGIEHGNDKRMDELTPL